VERVLVEDGQTIEKVLSWHPIPPMQLTAQLLKPPNWAAFGSSIEFRRDLGN
jgi:hypothetical protein